MEASSAIGIEIVRKRTDATKQYFKPDSDCGTALAGCNTDSVGVGNYKILLHNENEFSDDLVGEFGALEKTRDDFVKEFDKLYVKTLIESCIDKLGSEFDKQKGHTTCRRILSAPDSICRINLKDDEDEVSENEQELEVHYIQLKNEM